MASRTLLGRGYVLELYAVDLDAPLVGHVVEYHLQARVDGVARREGLVELELADHVTQRGLGEFLQCVGQVVDLVHRFLGVDDLEIEQGVDLGGHVVLGDHLLRREVVDLFAQVDGCRGCDGDNGASVDHGLDAAGVDDLGFVDKRPYCVQSRVEDAVEASETLDYAGFGLRHDLDACRHHDNYDQYY